MATYTDSFPGDGVLTGDWSSVVNGGLTATSGNVKRSAGSNPGVSALTGVTFDDDQYAEIELSFVQDYDYIGAAVRMDGSGNGYACYIVNGDGRLYLARLDAGVKTDLGFVSSTTVTIGDTVGVGIVGTTLKSYKNGVEVGSTTDATYSSGVAGVYYWVDDSNLTTGTNFLATGAQTGPSLTAGNPTDGTEATVTTSGLTTYTSGTLGGKAITLSGTIPNLAYTFTTFGGTSSGTSPRIGEAVNLSVTGAEGTATTSVTPQPQAGTAAITLAGTLEKSAGQLLPAIDTALSVTTAVTDQIYYATADSTSITATGVLTSDATSIQMWLLQGGDADNAATSTPFVVTFNGGIVVNGSKAVKSISISSIRIGI